MALKDEQDYRKAQEKLSSMLEEYERLRTMEDGKKIGSDTREKVKAMMEPLNELRAEVDKYEIDKGLRPEGAFVTTKEIK